jgi:hypothetical protein
VKKYDKFVSTRIPALSKEFLKKNRFPNPPTFESTVKSIVYFNEDLLSTRWGRNSTILCHPVGRVNFYRKEIFGPNIKYRKGSIRANTVPEIKYYFKAAENFGYTPLPSVYTPGEAAVLQRENKIKYKRVEVQRIFKLLLSNPFNTGEAVKTSTELKEKVYKKVPSTEVPIEVPGVEDNIEGPHPRPYVNPNTGLLTSRTYDYAPGSVSQYDKVPIETYAKRVLWFAKYQNGPTGVFRTNLPKTYQGWSDSYYGVYNFVREIPPEFTAYQAGVTATNVDFLPLEEDINLGDYLTAYV